MPPASARRLAEYLDQRVGDDLRSVVCYDEGECEILFVRDDVRREGLADDAERTISYLRHESLAREQRLFPFGSLNGTVRSFERAVVMHFPLTQARGVVVTLDPNTARQLNRFMNDCIERLESAGERAPGNEWRGEHPGDGPVRSD